MGKNRNFNFFCITLCSIFFLIGVTNLSAAEYSSKTSRSSLSRSKTSGSPQNINRQYMPVSSRQTNDSIRAAEELANLSELQERAFNPQPSAGQRSLVDRRFNRH